MSDPWQNVRAGDPTQPRTAKHLVAQAQQNQALRGSVPMVAGLVDMAGPPTWDRQSWEQFYAATGRYPFSASELPPTLEGCPAWAYEMMGLRPPLMAS